jgi:hypothetical protein
MHMNKGILALSFVAATLNAQQPTMSISPSSPAPGALVRVTLRGVSSSVDALNGEMAGEQLHFQASSAGVWTAIGPVPGGCHRKSRSLRVDQWRD